jgi:hypothetical protein
VRPSGQDADENQDQDNQQNGAKTHDLLLFYSPPPLRGHQLWMPPLGGQARRISATPKIVCSLTHTGRIPPRAERAGPGRITSFVGFPTLLLTFLRLTLLWFLRGSLALRSFVLALRSSVLALRPWCLLLTLGRPLLWLLKLLWLLRLSLGFWFLCGSLALRSSVLDLRPWCRLLTLGRPLLRLLPLRLGCRATLLRKRPGSGGPRNVCATPFWRLSAWGRGSALLE